jgi:hypothetical protein
LQSTENPSDHSLFDIIWYYLNKNRFNAIRQSIIVWNCPRLSF